MKRPRTIGMAFLVLMALAASVYVPAAAHASAETEASPGSSVDKADKKVREAAPTGFSFRLEYLRREDVTQLEDYARIGLAYDADNRFFHPRFGVEARVSDSRLRSYYLGNDIPVKKRAMIHLRLNHTEFGDWKTAINYLNAYVSYERWWLRLAGGWGYAALIFDENDYQTPFLYDTETPETRFIYNVSLRPSIWKGRIELDVGISNFDNFEYHGFDDNGYHIEPIFHVTDNTTVSYFYERRYSAAFISIPTLVRTTWMVSIEHRFK